jgi:CheY-like chemotaxis protein
MRTLLLADDSVTTQRVVALTFADESFRVVTVSDGQQAIDSMAAMRPDIVLAGTTLARTNGYELAEYMRGVATLREVPVLLLSGAFESVDSARLKASGARGVIEKPLEPTAVISRVKELLGLKDTRPAPATGRLVTSVEAPTERPAPRAAAVPPAPRQPSVSSWDELRQETGLEPDAPSVQSGAAGAGREDYLNSLDAAFDSLDQHLAGRHPAEAHPQHRNPSPPLGQAAGAADPRSPGRRPPATSETTPRHSVFEVDTDWFAADNRKSDDRAAQQDMVADAHEAMPARPDASGSSSVFEVDDEWFAQDDKAREALRQQQQQLAAEMGIHDVELPEAEPAISVAAPPEGLDFDFGLDDINPVGQVRPGPAPDSPFAPPSPGPTPVAIAPPVAPQAPVAPVAPAATMAPIAPPVSFASSSVADDFAALLAFETGEPVPHHDIPAAAAPTVVADAGPPEITSEMLDQIADRVAERLSAGGLGADLRHSMTEAIRDTVRAVVSDTSERLVRDEIARIKDRIERDTQ